MRLIQCNVWCITDAEKEQLGLDGGDEWIPFIFDIHKIHSAKEAGSNDFIGNGKTSIYTGNDHFVIDINFIDFSKIWMDIEVAQLK